MGNHLSPKYTIICVYGFIKVKPGKNPAVLYLCRESLFFDTIFSIHVFFPAVRIT